MRYIEFSPDDPEMRINLAMFHLDRDEFEKALELAPDSPRAFLTRGNIHIATGDYAAALKDFSRVVERAPGRGVGWLNRGTAHLYLNELEKAERDFSKVIEIGRDEVAAAYWRRGETRLRAGDPRGAVGDLEKALELGPPDEDAARALLKEARAKLKP